MADPVLSEEQREALRKVAAYSVLQGIGDVSASLVASLALAADDLRRENERLHQHCATAKSIVEAVNPVLNEHLMEPPFETSAQAVARVIRERDESDEQCGLLRAENERLRAENGKYLGRWRIAQDDRNAYELQITEAMRLLNPVCKDETLCGAIKNVLQAKLSAVENSDKAFQLYEQFEAERDAALAREVALAEQLKLCHDELTQMEPCGAGCEVTKVLADSESAAKERDARLVAEAVERWRQWARNLLDLVAPLSRRTAGSDEAWEQAVRGLRELVDDSQSRLAPSLQEEVKS